MPSPDDTNVVVARQVLCSLHQRVGGRGPQPAESVLPGGRERPGGSPGGQPGPGGSRQARRGRGGRRQSGQEEEAEAATSAGY